MKQRKGWTLPVLGATILSLMAVSGCGGGSNGNSPFIGFTGGGSGGSGGNGGSGVNSGIAAPYVEIVNQASVAEFGLNTSTGAMTPVDFNPKGTNGVQNTFQLAGTGGPIFELEVGPSLITGDNIATLCIGTATGVQVLAVDETTGIISNVLDQATGQPELITTGAQVVGVTGTDVFDTTGNLTLSTLYAVLSNSTVEAFNLGPLTENGDGSFTLGPTPINFNQNTNVINTGITSPVQVIPLRSTSAAVPSILYVLNQGGGTGSIAGFSVNSGANNTVAGGLTPLQMTGSANTVTGNGMDIPTAMGLFQAPVFGLAVVSQNNTISTFDINDTSNLGVLTASGNTTAQNVSQPTSIVGIGDLLYVTSSQGGTGSVEAFGVEENGNNPNQLTVVPAGNGSSNSITTGINLPESSDLLIDGLNAFLYVSNDGGGTGSLAAFSIDATTGLPVAVTGTNGSNVVTQGITLPAVNPQNMTIVVGPSGNIIAPNRIIKGTK